MKEYLHNLLRSVFSAAISICLFSAVNVSAQIPSTGGTYTIDTTSNNTFTGGSIGNFKSFKRAFAALNATTTNSIAGAVTFNVTEGETFGELPSIITYTNLNAAAPGIIFQNSVTPGTNNPVLLGTSGSGAADFIIQIKGGNHYTFNGINLFDNPINNTNNLDMEAGLYLATDASNTISSSNNTIENCTVSLNLNNTNTTGCIQSVTNAVSNSNNCFYNNTVQNAAYGYCITNTSGSVADNGNIIGTINGGTSTIQNFKQYGVYVNSQNNIKVYNTTITNAGYTTGASTEYGIYYASSFYIGSGQFFGNNINSFTTSAQAFGIYVSTSVSGTNIFSNTIGNFTSTNTGTSGGWGIKGINVSSGNTNIYGNSIGTLIHTVSGNCDDVAGISVGGTTGVGSIYTLTANITGNTVTNLNVYSGSSCSNVFTNEIGGILLTPGTINTPVFNVSYNTVSNVSGTSGEMISGISVKAGSYNIPNCAFNNNIVFNISSQGGGQATAGLSLASMDSPTIANNLVYNIYNSSASGSGFYGINDLSTGSSVYNNFVYGIYANTGTGIVYGIAINNNGTHRVYYNTVYLDGSFANTSSGNITAAFYATALSANAILDYRNNIFLNNYNLSTSSSSARNYAFYDAPSSAHDYSSLAITSNNNLLYAGGNGSKNAIFYDGTTAYSTLALYQAQMLTAPANSMRETAVVTLVANTPSTLFTQISALPYNLKLQTPGATDAINKGTLNLGTPFSADYYGDLHPTGSNQTSIGADEVCGSGVPAAAGSITGSSSVCAGITSVNYSISAIANAGGYTWTVPTGATVASGTNTNSIIVSYSPGAVSGNVTVSAFNGCGTGASSTLAVTVNTLPAAAPAINGPTQVCAGQPAVYSIPTLNNATGYAWTVPGNATLNSGQGTNSVNVTFNGGGSVLKTGTGTISCSTSNYIVTGTGTQFLTEEYIGAALFDPATGDAIGWIAAIASNTQLYLNGANNPALTLTNSAFEYGGTLSPITGTGYQSSCGGTGFTGVGTSFTSQLNVNDVIFYAQNSVSCCAGFYNAVNLVSSINSNTSVTLAGSAYGTCTTGSPGEPMNHGGTSPITGSITISGTTLTGVGTKFTTELFPGALIVSGTINYVNFGMVSYVTDDTHATLCPGTSSLTNASGFRHTGGFPLPFTGNITITPTGVCGASASSSIGVTINAAPTVSVSSPNPLVSCGGKPVTLNATAQGTGTLTYAWSPATGLSATTAATVSASPSVATTYTFEATNAAGCSAADTIAVAVSRNLSGIYIVDNTILGAANLFPNTNVFSNFYSIAAVMPCIVGPTTFIVQDNETFKLTGPVSFTFANSNAYPIIFVRSNTGGQPVVQAYTGNGSADYMFQLNGSSYFTFNGLNFQENPANTTAATEMEAAFEFTPGFGFGCTHDTVENCNISLSILNTNTSDGILTAVPSGTATPNSYNTFYNNTIMNVGYGLYLINNNTVAGSNADYGNSVNANTITNFRLGGVYASTQDSFRVYNNTINDNAVLVATGTITAATGSTTLTGTATNFTSQLYPGAVIVNTSGALVGTVASVSSPTSATLTANASSAITSGAFAVYSSTSGLNGIYATYGFTAPNTQMMKFYSNDIINLGSTSSVHGYYQGSNVYQADIYSNTVNNMIATSGELIGINIGGGNFNMNNNYVNNLNHVVTGTSGVDVAGIELGGSNGGSGNCTTANIIGNTVSNINTNTIQYSSSSFYNESGGILIGPSGTSMPSALNVSNNNVSFIVNSPTTGGDYHCGIGIKSGTGSAYSMPNGTFSNNIIHDISSTSTGNREMSGLRVLGFSSCKIFNNLIYNITCTNAGSQTSGLLVDDGTSNTGSLIYNNVIFGVYATSSGNITAGLALHQPGYTYTGTSINGLHQVYYNSVYLDGTLASGTNGYTAAFYSDADGTTNGLDYRNNIFINNVNVANAASAARAYAFYYNSTGYAGILASATASNNPNNNLLYAGTPGTKNCIFYNGSTSYQTLAAYKTAIQSSGANREAAAATLVANIPSTLFINIATLPYDLHLLIGATDVIQKGTLPLGAPYLSDHDGNIRPESGATYTTIGAYELLSCPASAAGAAGTITGAPSVCRGQTGVTYSVAAITNVVSGNYIWTVPTGATIASGTGTNSILVNFANPASTGNVAVYGFNNCGNGASSSLAVTVKSTAVPSSTFMADFDSICSGEKSILTYTGNASATATYAWVVSGGTPTTSTTRGPQTITWAGAGTYAPQLTVTDSGCTSSTTDTIVVSNPFTSAFVVSPPSVCGAGKPVTLTYTGDAPRTAIFNWNFGGGTVISGNGMGPYSVSWPATGAQTISLTVGSGNCISSVTTETATVNVIPTSTFNIDDDSICVGGSTIFTFTGIAPVGATYGWTFTGGTPSTGSGAGPQTVTWPATGTYSPKLVVTDNGCASITSSATIVVNGSVTPAVSISANPSGVICSGNSISFTATSANAGTNPYYQWKKDGINVGSNSVTYIDSSLVNGDVITCLLTSSDNCASVSTVSANSITITTTTLSITAQPNNQSVNQGNNAKFIVAVSGTPITYQWQADSGTGFQNLTNAGQYSGVNTDTLTVSPASTVNNDERFRCIVHSGQCTDTSTAAVLDVILTGIASVEGGNVFTVFPNPAGSEVIVSSTTSVIRQIKMLNLLGQEVKFYEANAKKVSLSITDLPEGVYFVLINNSGKPVKLFKVD